jgi:hypothetical protein
VDLQGGEGADARRRRDGAERWRERRAQAAGGAVPARRIDLHPLFQQAGARDAADGQLAVDDLAHGERTHHRRIEP